MNVSVVIPVYNSSEILPELVGRLETVLKANYEKYELILVNDGSRDESWDVIRRLVENHPWIRGIDLMRNYGQHNALLCGIRLARYEVTVTMDDDLQHPPEEIPKLVDRLTNGPDVVYGAPEEQQHGILRNMSSTITKAALKASMGVETAKMVSAFRAFKTNVRKAFDGYKGSFVSIDVLLTWGTMKFDYVKVRHDMRFKGSSNYSFYKLLTHAMNMMTGFSVLPLQLASYMGFFFTVFGLIVFMYVIINYLLRGGSIPGFTFLACTISIMTGVQLLILGIYGEYLARIHFRMMDRPGSTIREVIQYDANGNDA